eukprot:TRINITY_DN23068_c0_g1_i4.p1 TRINITY_DN23068_c0_g1~~TRINITY_DN23068_c0_g1_i4.p1  ORF type:complete len:1001 (+),score=230.81 TRINITY_DN23068_c0_g1_i4:104-3106(+)
MRATANALKCRMIGRAPFRSDPIGGLPPRPTANSHHYPAGRPMRLGRPPAGSQPSAGSTTRPGRWNYGAAASATLAAAAAVAGQVASGGSSGSGSRAWAACRVASGGVGVGRPQVRCCASAATSGAQTATKPSFEDVVIEKPQTDYRDYRSARLGNNLQVLTVSDPKCDRAAAALSVGVGSLFDPKDVQGIAHFCEHMLFLGTRKYPSENEYNEYLAKNGGYSNAYTAETVTNYFFSVKPEALDGALDRFAQFFIEPLFTESATGRELQAVDSEHSKNLQQDSWRQMQLLRDAAEPTHPLNHFMTGNSTTLKDLPEEIGLDVRQALLDFHEKYYSANIMKLVIVGKETSDELLSMAQERFASVLDRTVIVPQHGEIGNNLPAFPPSRLGRLVHVVPVKDYRSAKFEFFMPTQKAFWRSKPGSYVSYLVGHEGAGSLLGALKRRGLATELSAGGSLDEAGTYCFGVTVMLTELGEQNLAEVGELLFSYLGLARAAGPSELLWKENQKLSDMGFRFRSLVDAESTASGLAHSLQEYPVDVSLSASSRVWDYEPEKIRQVMENLKCENLRLVVVGKAFEERCTQEGSWYGTKHSDEALPKDLSERWERCAVKPCADDLAMPLPNPFVPEDLMLRPAASQREVPVQLKLSEKLSAVTTAFFKKDEEFKLPKAVCAFQLYCPFTTESATNSILSELWCMSVKEELNEFSYDARVAGLSYALSSTSSGIVLSVGGYNDKLGQLLKSVAEKMAAMSEVSEQTFGIVRTVLERNLVNAATRAQPYQQAVRHEQQMMAKPAISYEERLEALRKLEGGHKALSKVNRRLLDSCHVEVLLQGNLVEATAQELVESFVQPAGIVTPLKELPPSGTAALPQGITLLEREGTDAAERNCGVVVTFQVAEASLANRCLSELLGQILGQRFFDDLRTKQQLGYIVNGASYGERHAFVGLRLLVQSEKPPREVTRRVMTWFEETCKFLEADLTEEEFKEHGIETGVGEVVILVTSAC